MAKKNELPVPDYDKVRSIAKVEKHIAECQRTITRKYGLRVQAESARSDMTASYNEQIKHLKEELDHELGVLSAWDQRKKVLAANGTEEDEEDQPDAPAAPAPAAGPTSIPPPVAIPVPSAPAAPQPVAAAPPPPPLVLPATPATQIPMPAGGLSLVPFPTKKIA